MKEPCQVNIKMKKSKKAQYMLYFIFIAFIISILTFFFFSEYSQIKKPFFPGINSLEIIKTDLESQKDEIYIKQAIKIAAYQSIQDFS